MCIRDSIHEYLLDKGIRVDGIEGVRYVYHDPCHSPMKRQDALKTVNGLIATAATGDAAPILRTDRCCGEAGTMAVSRPDVATQVRLRKETELRADEARLRADGFDGQLKVLTSCPSCLQGLSRFEEAGSVQADYLVVELARHLLGASWMANYVRHANRGGIERVLV